MPSDPLRTIATVSFSDAIKRAAFRRSGGRCECRRASHKHPFGRCLSFFLTSRSAEYHHVHADSRGGGGGLSNCEVLCVSCHRRTDSYGRH